MPTKESPSCNSTRIQKAYRLNSIEQTRLQRQLTLIDREQQHVVRTNTQEKRRAQITLDHLSAHSGHSPFGLAPSEKPKEMQDEHDPTFMYGERLKSRRFGKFRRAQSALESGSKRGNRSKTGSELESGTSKSRRPKTSPPKRLIPQATPFGFDDVIGRVMSKTKSFCDFPDGEQSTDDETDSIPDSSSFNDYDVHGGFEHRAASTIPPLTQSPEPYMQRTSLKRPKTSNGRTRVNIEQISDDGNQHPDESNRKIQPLVEKTLTQDSKKPNKIEVDSIIKAFQNANVNLSFKEAVLKKMEQLDNHAAYIPEAPKIKTVVKGSKPHGRNSEIVQIVNKARTMSSAAKRWRNMTTKGYSFKPDDGAVNWSIKKEKSQQKLDFAVSTHSERCEGVKDRLKDFLQQYKLNKYNPTKRGEEINE